MAHAITSNPSPYEEGVYFLTTTVHEVLTLSFFYQRLANELASGALSGIPYEQAWYAHVAMFDLIAVDLSRLIENRGDSWNFDQLFKLWVRLVNDSSRQRATRQAINGRATRFDWLAHYRKNKVAHRSKKIPSNQLTALPQNVDGLDEVARVMDMFVEGQIPYILHFHASSQQINLRVELGIS